MTKHNELKKTALSAIDELFADKSVSQEQTKKSLEDLIDSIEGMIETLQINEILRLEKI